MERVEGGEGRGRRGSREERACSQTVGLHELHVSRNRRTATARRLHVTQGDSTPAGTARSLEGRFGMIIRMPLLAIHASFNRADALRMLPSPLQPSQAGLKYALHRGGITSQRWIQHTACSTDEGARAAPAGLLEPAKS